MKAALAEHTGAGVELLEAVNVAMPGNQLLVPDVVVVTANVIDETTTRIPAEAVLAPPAGENYTKARK